MRADEGRNALPLPAPLLGQVEFVFLSASLMAMSALGIDGILAGLPAIGASLGVADPAQYQWAITAYLPGFGLAQIIYGPISDRFGRRAVLLVTIAVYTTLCFATGFVTDFRVLVILRLAQGIAVASTPVLAISVIRDRFDGRTMARIISLATLVFLMVPTLGALIMLIASWRAIFFAFALYGALVGLRVALRLPETLRPEHVRRLDPASIIAAMRSVLTNRQTIGCIAAQTFLQGVVFGFINSVEPIALGIFHNPILMPATFLGLALASGTASVINARVVGRFGMRRVSHSALSAFVIVECVHLAIALTHWESQNTFAGLQIASMFCFGLAVGNFSAMAMEPMGDVAGTAASMQGSLTTVGAALIGLMIGQRFDGTTIPLAIGFVVCALLAFLVVFSIESGRLFTPHIAD